MTEEKTFKMNKRDWIVLINLTLIFIVSWFVPDGFSFFMLFMLSPLLYKASGNRELVVDIIILLAGSSMLIGFWMNEFIITSEQAILFFGIMCGYILWRFVHKEGDKVV